MCDMRHDARSISWIESYALIERGLKMERKGVRLTISLYGIQPIVILLTYLMHQYVWYQAPLMSTNCADLQKWGTMTNSPNIHIIPVIIVILLYSQCTKSWSLITMLVRHKKNWWYTANLLSGIIRSKSFFLESSPVTSVFFLILNNSSWFPNCFL